MACVAGKRCGQFVAANSVESRRVQVSAVGGGVTCNFWAAPCSSGRCCMCLSRHPAAHAAQSWTAWQTGLQHTPRKTDLPQPSQHTHVVQHATGWLQLGRGRGAWKPHLMAKQLICIRAFGQTKHAHHSCRQWGTGTWCGKAADTRHAHVSHRADTQLEHVQVAQAMHCSWARRGF